MCPVRMALSTGFLPLRRQNNFARRSIEDRNPLRCLISLILPPREKHCWHGPADQYNLDRAWTVPGVVCKIDQGRFMSILSTPLPHGFDLLTQSMIQASDLPLSEVLDCSIIAEAFEDDDVDFGKADEDVFTPAITLYRRMRATTVEPRQRSPRQQSARLPYDLPAKRNLPVGRVTIQPRQSRLIKPKID